MNLKNIFLGMKGTLTELSIEKLTKDYSQYLTFGETIYSGFILVRDVIIFTDKRIIDIDKQGLFGRKVEIISIELDSIINISMESIKFGIDDSELNIDYIPSPYTYSSEGISIHSKKFKFPKKYTFKTLYAWLEGMAYSNHLHISVHIDR